MNQFENAEVFALESEAKFAAETFQLDIADEQVCLARVVEESCYNPCLLSDVVFPGSCIAIFTGEEVLFHGIFFKLGQQAKPVVSERCGVERSLAIHAVTPMQLRS